MLVMLIFLLMFSHVFFLRLGIKPDSYFGYHDDGEESHFSPLSKTLQTMYTLAFLGVRSWCW